MMIYNENIEKKLFTILQRIILGHCNIYCRLFLWGYILLSLVVAFKNPAIKYSTFEDTGTYDIIKYN